MEGFVDTLDGLDTAGLAALVDTYAGRSANPTP
jgi:hypothetical protein